MKTLLFGILLIILVGVGGLVYRNAVEHSSQAVACPVDAKVCPDGTSLAREGLSCVFPACPLPNISLDAAGIAYAVPAGFTVAPLPDNATVAAYQTAAVSEGSTTESSSIIIRHYPIAASSTALATIQKTAISSTSGAPVSTTAYSSTSIAGRQFTVVAIERFEGVVDTAFYLSRASEVLRFDARDQGVTNWTDPTLDLATLPAERALRQLLSTLQGQ